MVYKYIYIASLFIPAGDKKKCIFFFRCPRAYAFIEKCAIVRL